MNISKSMLGRDVYPVKSKRAGGFSLIELLLVVVIGSSIILIAAPYSINFYRSYLLEDIRDNAVDNLQKARHNAVLQKNDSSFGVKIDDDDTDTITLFQGDTYELKVSEFDEVYSLLPEIVVSGPKEIVFSKLTGLPSATGTMSFSNGNFSRGILMGESGTISKIDIIITP
jgi:prepilin-type N-terminal cleavage/methylation domain-containing protein